MISGKKLLQFNIENIRQAFVGGVVNNYIVIKTLLSAIALLYIFAIVGIVLKRFIKKTNKFGKFYFFDYCFCGVCWDSMSCSYWRVKQMQQDFVRYCKKDNKKHFWQHHHNNGDHLPLHPVLPKKCNNLITIAKRFASMMRV